MHEKVKKIKKSKNIEIIENTTATDKDIGTIKKSEETKRKNKQKEIVDQARGVEDAGASDKGALIEGVGRGRGRPKALVTDREKVRYLKTVNSVIDKVKNGERVDTPKKIQKILMKRSMTINENEMNGARENSSDCNGRCPNINYDNEMQYDDAEMSSKNCNVSKCVRDEDELNINNTIDNSVNNRINILDKIELENKEIETENIVCENIINNTDELKKKYNNINAEDLETIIEIIKLRNSLILDKKRNDELIESILIEQNSTEAPKSDNRSNKEDIDYNEIIESEMPKTKIDNKSKETEDEKIARLQRELEEAMKSKGNGSEDEMNSKENGNDDEINNKRRKIDPLQNGNDNNNKSKTNGNEDQEDDPIIVDVKENRKEILIKITLKDDEFKKLKDITQIRNELGKFEDIKLDKIPNVVIIENGILMKLYSEIDLDLITDKWSKVAFNGVKTEVIEIPKIDEPTNKRYTLLTLNKKVFDTSEINILKQLGMTSLYKWGERRYKLEFDNKTEFDLAIKQGYIDILSTNKRIIVRKFIQMQKFKYCECCRVVGHKIEDCRKVEKALADSKCYKCNSPDHLSDDCDKQMNCNKCPEGKRDHIFGDQEKCEFVKNSRKEYRAVLMANISKISKTGDKKVITQNINYTVNKNSPPSTDNRLDQIVEDYKQIKEKINDIEKKLLALLASDEIT
jgi:hypothetical protein